MDEEIKKLLQENLEISKESLKILKSFKRKNQLAFLFKLIYWLAIVVLFINAYYYLKPYFEKAKEVFQIIEKITGGM
jgi:hypothetical protein